jgi:hypothetical protein
VRASPGCAGSTHYSSQIKRINVDLYESMVFWFAKEFVKAVLGLGLILGIVVFFQWINSDD